jgi:hypothetical protein
VGGIVIGDALKDVIEILKENKKFAILRKKFKIPKNFFFSSLGIYCTIFFLKTLKVK